MNNDNQAMKIHRWDNKDEEGDSGQWTVVNEKGNNTDDQEGNNADGADDTDGESWGVGRGGREPLSFVVSI